VDLFADMPVESFGPSELKAMRTSLIARGQCRNTVNRRAKQVIAMVRWAVEEGHASESVWARLRAVRPIPPGREGSHDYCPIGPVSIDHFVAVNKLVAPRYRPALDVQRLTGMRSGELLSMRPQDVDMTGRHWYYRPVNHKTKRYVKEKIIGIPEPAANVLTACMPRTWADRWFPWSVDTHRQAVARACVSAEIPTWHPHQLRHGLATHLERIMGESGREAARLLLSHTNAKTTERYVAPSPESLAVILDMISDQSDF
jgi:integrase